MHLLGIPVPSSTLERWRDIFVFSEEPLFLTEDLLHLTADLHPAPRTRRGDLNYADAYQTYHVGPSATHLVYALPASIRQHPHHGVIMQAQLRLGRGQMYPVSFVEQVLGGLPDRFKMDLFETEHGPHLALRRDIWKSLAAEQKDTWIRAFIETGREPCLSSGLAETQWERIGRHCGPRVREYAGTFAPNSGPNCLATAVAPLKADPALSRSLLNTWLHPEPFLQELHGMGFAPAEMHPEDPAPESVLVFLDARNQVQHACLHLTDGLVLNKDAQGWFAPRQIRPLRSVLKAWLQPGWRVQCYRRQQTETSRMLPGG